MEALQFGKTLFQNLLAAHIDTPPDQLLRNQVVSSGVHEVKMSLCVCRDIALLRVHIVTDYLLGKVLDGELQTSIHYGGFFYYLSFSRHCLLLL